MAEPTMTFKSLFGSPDEVAPVKTTLLGIRVQAHGYDEPLEGKALRKRLKKSLAYLDALGCSGNLQNEFEDYLLAFPESVVNWIDAGEVEQERLTQGPQRRQCGHDTAAM